MDSDIESEESEEGNVEPLRRFIETYESLPQLWNVSHHAYKNRTKRNKALDQLIPVYAQIKPGATRDDVRKKINSLRTNFRSEIKLMVSSRRSGAARSEVYTPKSWTFHALQFLKGTEQPVPASRRPRIETSQLEQNDQPASTSQTVQRCPTQQADEDGQIPSTSANPPPSPAARISRSSLDPELPVPPVPPKKRRRAGAVDRQNQLLELACNYLEQPQEIPAIVKVWGEKLVALEQTQRVYAEKLINDVLFEANFGNLDRNSLAVVVRPSVNISSDLINYSQQSDHAPYIAADLAEQGKQDHTGNRFEDISDTENRGIELPEIGATKVSQEDSETIVVLSDDESLIEETLFDAEDQSPQVDSIKQEVDSFEEPPSTDGQTTPAVGNLQSEGTKESTVIIPPTDSTTNSDNIVREVETRVTNVTTNRGNVFQIVNAEEIKTFLENLQTEGTNEATVTTNNENVVQVLNATMINDTMIPGNVLQVVDVKSIGQFEIIENNTNCQQQTPDGQPNENENLNRSTLNESLTTYFINFAEN